jgi:hypothetical protein
MLFVVDHPGAEAVAEEVSVAAVPLVERLRIAPVEPLHAV